jgi:hypothetical protein
MYLTQATISLFVHPLALDNLAKGEKVTMYTVPVTPGQVAVTFPAVWLGSPDPDMASLREQNVFAFIVDPQQTEAPTEEGEIKDSPEEIVL